MTELERAWKEAWTIENREAQGSSSRVMFIGQVDKETHIYEFYKDTEGKYWYKAKLRLEDGQIIDRGSLFLEPKKKHKERWTALVREMKKSNVTLQK